MSDVGPAAGPCVTNTLTCIGHECSGGGSLGAALGVLPHPVPATGAIVAVTIRAQEKTTTRAMDVCTLDLLDQEMTMQIASSSRIVVTAEKDEYTRFVLGRPLQVTAGQHVGFLSCDGEHIRVEYSGGPGPAKQIYYCSVFTRDDGGTKAKQVAEMRDGKAIRMSTTRHTLCFTAELSTTAVF